MKSSILYLTMATTAIFALLMFAGCDKTDPATISGTNVPAVVADTGNEITPAELQYILRMREEEKLARDVYIDMYSRWEYRVFNNIQTAEQYHMDAMLRVMNRYAIGDPVAGNDTGVFTDPGLQALYDQLLEQGSVSAQEAMAVGVAIEETDIADIIAALEVTDNEDVRKVYENMLEASRRHLLAFSGHTPDPKTPISR